MMILIDTTVKSATNAFYVSSMPVIPGIYQRSTINRIPALPSSFYFIFIPRKTYAMTIKHSVLSSYPFPTSPFLKRFANPTPLLLSVSVRAPLLVRDANTSGEIKQLKPNDIYRRCLPPSPPPW